MPLPTMPSPEVRERTRLIDFGCGSGKSTRDAMKRFGTERGIGFDLKKTAVRAARRDGLDAYLVDLLAFDPSDFPRVEFVNLDNVLEHMPDLALVEAILAKALATASVAVHVRHPSFEDREYLADLGLKQFWTDWPKAHSAPIQITEFVEIGRRLGVGPVLIQPVGRIHDSSSPDLLPVDAPPDQVRLERKADVYDVERHGEKPEAVFDRPIYTAWDLVFVTGPEWPEVSYENDPMDDMKRPLIRVRDAAADRAPAPVG